MLRASLRKSTSSIMEARMSPTMALREVRLSSGLRNSSTRDAT
jgi:hypothetical protein